MTDYNADFFKDTVFLPKTDFPMRGSLPVREPETLQKWADMDLYKTLRTQSVDKPRWTLHDGPPYANGNIHIGHAVNKILKDIINKSKQMEGYNADYIPGWDCHGLPIEWKIEEKYRAAGKDKDDVDIVEFRKECREFAQYWVDVQADEFQRLGVVGNWEKPYLTMRLEAESLIASEIHKFVMNGGLYNGVKTVMWSPVEETALAEAEIEYQEHKSVTIWVRFPVVETSCVDLEGADCVIWTTTPWTLPSNRAMAAHSDIEYAVFTVEDVAEGSTAQIGDQLCFAINLVESVMTNSKITKWSQGRTIKGSEIIGTTCAHPLRGQGFDHKVPILDAPYVTDEAGTGIVHIAAAHGEEDYDLVMTHNANLDADDKIEITDNVADDGTFRDHVPLFGGMAVIDKDGKFSDGNFAPIKYMNEAGKLLAKGSQRHEYPHSWRSKAPIMYRAVPQWFISMKENNLRDVALQAIKDTRWVPSKGENRIRAMIENRPDWNISRQRAWGVPIAIFVHKETQEILCDETLNQRIADIFKSEGSDAWWARPAADFLGDSGTGNVDDYDQVFDIVDVWFESGSTHSFVLENGDWGIPSPADLYLEGSDQHRGWFHSSLLESCGTRGRAPYKNVLTHGFTLDKNGIKMSKSIGNIIPPQKVIDQYGADILRLWMVSADYENDHRIGDEILKGTSDLYRRVRNTFRFLLGALDGFNESEAVDLTDVTTLPELEQLALHELAKMDKIVKQSIADYDFGTMAKKLHEFCNQTLSAFYFDIRKDRLYCDRPDLFERRATRTVMAKILECLVTWYAPILSFTSEEAWTHCPSTIKGDIESVHLAEFSSIPDNFENTQLADKWAVIAEIRDAVLACLEPKRQDKAIGSSLEAHPIVTLTKSQKDALGDNDLADICIVSAVTIKDGDELGVEFQRAEGQKCERCWKVSPEVGSDTQFPTLTPRDADAVRWYLENDKVAA